FADRGKPRLVGNVLRDFGPDRRELELSAALLCAPASRMIDDESAHYPRRIRDEPRAVGEGGAVARGHLEIRFVEQRGDAQADGGAGSCELTLREPVQLSVQRAEQRFGRAMVALFSRSHERRDRALQGALLRSPSKHEKKLE